MRKVFLRSIISTLVMCAFVSSSFSVNADESKPNDEKIINNIENVTTTKDIVKSNKNNIVYLDEGVMSIPLSGRKPIAIKDDNNKEDLTVTLPIKNTGDISKISSNGTILYKNNSSNSSNIALQPKNDGFKALININDKLANKEYEFTFNLPKNSKLISAATYLGKEYDTKEVFVVDKNNIITSIISPAWAKDANGHNVSTYYKIVSNNKLVQVVEFTENTAFPVVADPNWTKIGKCAGSIAWAIGSGLFGGAKLIKIKKYIAELGGLQKAAKLLVGATTWEEKLHAGGYALINLAAELTGVAGIQANCF
uniref:Closticin 574 n=1 Tax=Clostridium tyrobutyricum TaxID=1519 RepID=Q8GCU9_CLOTY|nr:closticin 574 [Clostridium tyrobutyricum]